MLFKTLLVFGFHPSAALTSDSLDLHKRIPIIYKAISSVGMLVKRIIIGPEVGGYTPIASKV